MTAPSLLSLLAPPDRSAIEEKLLLSLQGQGFPITDWESGGTERTLVEMEADALTDLVASAIPVIVGGGYLGYATGDWLTFLAEQLYNLERIGATFTQQLETLSSVAGTGAITLSASQLQFQSAAGLIYFGPIATAADPGPTWTIPDGGSVIVTIQSEHPNDSADGLNYVDPAGTITKLLTQIAGVTCDNVAPIFSPVSVTGTGTGSVTPQETSSPTVPDAHAFNIRIEASGNLGVATFRWSMDGGELSDPVTTSALFDLPGLTSIVFADGVDSPSFVAGDRYNFATPGSPTIQQGTDEESDGSLAFRCRARWPSLSVIPTEDKYATWAKAASTQVTRVRVTPDLIIPGQLNVILAGQAGPVLPAVVNAVAAYIILREGIGSLSTVDSAAGLSVSFAATVYAPSDRIPAVQAAAQLAWNSFVFGADVAGELLLSRIVKLMEIAGCTDVDLATLRLNGVFANLQLADNQVATTTQVLASSLNWIGVKA